MHRREPSSHSGASRQHAGLARASRRRAGFSLIELLVVIMIIAILATLLLGAVQNARVAAREAAAIQDIKAFEKAIADFKAKFGVEPPSFIILYENGTSGSVPHWGSDPTPAWRDGARRASRAIIRELFPQYDFVNNYDIDGDGTIDAQPHILNGAECLAFFLGGLQQRVDTNGDGTLDSVNARGFSSNAATPFAGYPNYGGNRIGPFHEFAPNRFVDTDNDGIFEYVDSIPGQTKPILYFSSYGGQGYRVFGINTSNLPGNKPTVPDSVPEDDETPYINGQPAILSVYNQAPGNVVPPGTPPAALPAPYKENGYQLISPGFDGDYGLGGFCDATNGCRTQVNYVDPVGRDVDLRYERDNITNFKGGRLN